VRFRQGSATRSEDTFRESSHRKGETESTSVNKLSGRGGEGSTTVGVVTGGAGEEREEAELDLDNAGASSERSKTLKDAQKRGLL
jgi:hypothetical protein